MDTLVDEIESFFVVQNNLIGSKQIEIVYLKEMQSNIQTSYVHNYGKIVESEFFKKSP